MLARCPAYAATPLVRLPGDRTVWLKDESARMGLGSFKALGGAFAVARMIADAAGTVDPTDATAAPVAAGMTFITASAGNHGLSVAAGARVFGARAVIVLGADVPEAFAERIRRTGARVHRTIGSYEDSVAEAGDLADANGWLLLADGSWPDYVERPALVMEGYSVIAEECRSGFESGGDWPDEVLLQAGVGGLAGAMAGHIRAHWPVQPRITVVEPDRAPCLLNSVRAGRLERGPGPVSNMGRLDCKDASLLAFESLAGDADRFVTITDAKAQAAADSLAALGHPTTPSGAAGHAALGGLEFDPDARVLVILSEGPESA